MHITNRDLALVASAAFITTACAVLMTVRDLPVHDTLPPADPHAVQVLPTVTRQGGTKIDPQGPVRVRLEGGHARTVLLSCDLFKAERPVEDHQAWFASIPIGDCALAVDSSHPYAPVYPGDVLRCHVSGGRTECTGGLAKSRAATVDVRSDAPATLVLDGKSLGALPLHGLAMRVGRRDLRLDYPDGRSTHYDLVVEPDQRVNVHFPEPPPAAPPSPPPPARAPAAPAPSAPARVAAPVAADLATTGGSR